VRPAVFFSLNNTKATSSVDKYNGMYIGWKYGRIVHSSFKYSNPDLPLPNNEFVQRAGKAESFSYLSIGFRASF
jgi:hypothetical protein